MHDLTTALASLPAQAPAIAVIRHAARYPIADSTKPTLAEITSEGAAAATDLGRRLHGFQSIRIFHSPVKRCRQTAECIASGLLEKGVSVTQIAPETALGIDYILDLSEAGRLTDIHGEQFVRFWIEGRIPETVVRAAHRLAKMKLAYLAKKLAEAKADNRRLDLHITHDWNILILRELALGVRHEDHGWISYLDGIVGALSGQALELVFRNHRQIHKLNTDWFRET